MNQTVKLTSAITLNGVKTDTMTMREPTVGDQLSARKVAGADDGEYELHMFASVLGCAPSDLHQLTMFDYAELQKAWFRLVSRDESAGGGPR
ncbi:phage tail assembly protein [Chromobacterium subtsugae]|uniref:phage tail assembly protein n=1 Tax=Chromobacterium subtsugae TaxID=251747 RepID=UPI000640F7A2|nr:phage tail assembly protein [Chromobacterium subtsugae]